MIHKICAFKKFEWKVIENSKGRGLTFDNNDYDDYNATADGGYYDYHDYDASDFERGTSGSRKHF